MVLVSGFDKVSRILSSHSSKALSCEFSLRITGFLPLSKLESSLFEIEAKL
jgi:hypothetical protein